VIFFADARTLQLSHDRYRRDRTFHHRGKTQSPANGGACDACLCRALFSFSFSRLCHSRHQKLWQLTGRGASANLGSNSKTNLGRQVFSLTYRINTSTGTLFLARSDTDSQIGISGGNNSAMNLPELCNLSKFLSSNRFEPNEPKLGRDANRHKHPETFFSESRI